MSNRGLGLNFLNLQLSPVKFGVACAVTFFLTGVVTYVNYLNIHSILTYMIRSEKFLVKDVVLNNVEVVFDNENAKDTTVKSAVQKIQASTNRIEEILKKYDEFLDTVQKVVEQHLRSKGKVVADSLDGTIQSAKKVYGIDKETTESQNS